MLLVRDNFRPQSRSIFLGQVSLFMTLGLMYRYTTHSATSPMPWLFDEQEIYAEISEQTLPNFVLYKRRTTAEEHSVNNLLDLNHGGGPLMSRMCDVSEIYVLGKRNLKQLLENILC